jgi:hypothetical protein
VREGFHGGLRMIAYIGEAPGIVAGVMQVNVVIPAGARTGNLSLVVSIGVDRRDQQPERHDGVGTIRKTAPLRSRL